MKTQRWSLRACLASVLFLASICDPPASFAQGTAITYQGRLDDNGAPANGTYDLLFSVWTAATGPSQTGPTVTNANTSVTTGLFTVNLDFGSGVFTGPDRWLEIGVRTNGGGAFTVLTPRQKVTATPYAVQAANAATVPNLSITAAKLSAGVGMNGQVLKMSGGALSWQADNDTVGVTSVGTGTGLTGGPITTSGTLSIDPAVVPRLGVPNTFNAGPQLIQSGGSANKGLLVRGSSSQTANLQEWQNNAGSALASVSAFGVFSGNGSGLSSVNATLLDGLDSTAFWKLGGNSGTTPGTHFLGTTDNQALEFKVNGQRALRIEPGTVPNLIGGSFDHTVSSQAGVVIAGGGTHTLANASDYGAIGGGANNTINMVCNHASIAGGFANTIYMNSFSSFIGGGSRNIIQDNSFGGVIAGGASNVVQASAKYASVGGGVFNTNTGNFGTIGGGLRNAAKGEYATVPGGQFNEATTNAFAAGRRAKANHIGAFVWADSQNADFASTAANQFSVRAAGGVRLETGGAGMTLDGQSLLKGSPSVVVVDASGGGQFTTIGAALAGITPTATQPFILDVRPGIYFERVTMKSHVHLRGSGSASTILIYNPSGVTSDADRAVVRINSLTNVILSGLTFAGRAYTNSTLAPDTAVGIFDQGSSPLIRDCRFIHLNGTQPVPLANMAFGIVSSGSSPTIENCQLLGATAADGISLFQSTARISGSLFTNHWHGVTLDQSSAAIVNNDLRVAEGVWVRGATSGATVANNTIRSSGGGTIGVRNEGDLRMVGNEVVGVERGVLNSGPAVVSGNVFNGCTFQGISDTGLTRSTITGNRFISCGGSGERAISLGNSSSVVVGNTFASSPFGDISVGSGGSPIINNNHTSGAVSGTSTIAGFANTTISATTTNLSLNASSGVGIGTSSPGTALHVHTPTSVDCGLTLSSGGSWKLTLNQSPGSVFSITNGGQERFVILPGGNVGIGTNNPGQKLHVIGNILASGTVTGSSDRDAKTDFGEISADAILKKVVELPITSWRFKSEDAGVRHVGPMAQDFHAAFGLGDSDKSIATVDADGVALAAIQGLNQKLETMLGEKEKRIRELESLVAKLADAVKTLTAQ